MSLSVLSFFVDFRKYHLWMTIGVFLFLPSLVYSQPSHFNSSSLPPIQRGEFLIAQSFNHEALRLYKTLIDEKKEGGYAFRGMVRAYKNMNKLEEAKNWIENFLVKNPGSSPALYGSGYVFYLKDDMKMAEQLFDQALEVNPKNSLALNNIGAILSRKQSYAQAVEKVREAIYLNPKEPMFFKNLETIYKKMGNPNLIIADYDSSLEQGLSDLARGYGRAVGRNIRQAGFKLYDKGRLDDAIMKFIEIETIYKNIRHLSGLVPVYFSLGLLYEEKGDLQNAKKYFNMVLEHNSLHLQAKERLERLK